MELGLLFYEVCFREDTGTQFSQREKRINDNLNVLRSFDVPLTF